MAVDLSEFRELNGSLGGAGCSAASFIASLDELEGQQVAEALADQTIQSSAIHKWLKRRGYQRGEDTVRKHRGGRCACGRA